MTKARRSCDGWPSFETNLKAGMVVLESWVTFWTVFTPPKKMLWNTTLKWVRQQPYADLWLLSGA
jgi:hypothetical protein